MWSLFGATNTRLPNHVKWLHWHWMRSNVVSGPTWYETCVTMLVYLLGLFCVCFALKVCWTWRLFQEQKPNFAFPSIHDRTQIHSRAFKGYMLSCGCRRLPPWIPALFTTFGRFSFKDLKVWGAHYFSTVTTWLIKYFCCNKVVIFNVELNARLIGELKGLIL